MHACTRAGSIRCTGAKLSLLKIGLQTDSRATHAHNMQPEADSNSCKGGCSMQVYVK